MLENGGIVLRDNSINNTSKNSVVLLCSKCSDVRNWDTKATVFLDNFNNFNDLNEFRNFFRNICRFSLQEKFSSVGTGKCET